jgi:kynurenine formamidase
MAKLVDLSMMVHGDMVVFPRVARPILTMLETHEDYANNMGTTQYGVDKLTAHCLVVLGDHVGTHVDSRFHIVPDAPSVEGIPLQYCYGDGVLLDFTDKPAGFIIQPEDIDAALKKINYTVKPLDIVLIYTGASDYNNEQRYLVEHSGMSGEATKYLIDKGVKMMGCDAPTFDPPVKTMFETKKFWEAHRVMWTEEYYHLENMANFKSLPRPYGFKLAVFPVLWKGTTGSPVRAVAIYEDMD